MAFIDGKLNAGTQLPTAWEGLQDDEILSHWDWRSWNLETWPPERGMYASNQSQSDTHNSMEGHSTSVTAKSTRTAATGHYAVVY